MTIKVNDEQTARRIVETMIETADAFATSVDNNLVIDFDDDEKDMVLYGPTSGNRNLRAGLLEGSRKSVSMDEAVAFLLDSAGDRDVYLAPDLAAKL